MEKAIIYTSIFSALAPLFMGASAFKTSERFQKIIYLLVIVSFTSDIISNIGARLYGHNYLIINVYYLLELGILISFFYNQLPQKTLVRIIGVVLLSILIGSLFYYGLMSRPIIYRSINNIFQIVLSVLLYYKIFTKEENIFIEHLPVFWFNTAILIYFSVSLFSYLLSKEILSNSSIPWTFHNIANILKNIFFAIGLWKARTIR